MKMNGQILLLVYVSFIHTSLILKCKFPLKALLLTYNYSYMEFARTRFLPPVRNDSFFLKGIQDLYKYQYTPVYKIIINKKKVIKYQIYTMYYSLILKFTTTFVLSQTVHPTENQLLFTSHFYFISIFLMLLMIII